MFLLQLVNHYLSQLDTTELHRRGFAQAIGNLPTFVLKGRLATVLPSLINRTKVGRVVGVDKNVTDILELLFIVEGRRRGEEECLQIS